MGWWRLPPSVLAHDGTVGIEPVKVMLATLNMVALVPSYSSDYSQTDKGGH